jgi:glycosyltransferase involved in cell wall biosynthesis
VRDTIIYIGGFELPDKNAAAQRVMANAKIFRDLGYNVIFIGFNKSLQRDSRIINTKTVCSGFEAWSVPYPAGKLDWLKQIINPIGLKEIIGKLDTNIHSIICYNYPAIAEYRVKRICKKNNALFIPDVTEWYGTSSNGYVTSLIKWIDTSLRMRVVNFLADGLITTSTYLTEFYISKVNNIVELPTLYDKIALKNNVEFFQKNDQKIKRILYAGNPFSANTSKNSKSGVKERLDKVIALLGKVENKNFILDIYGIDKNRYLEVYPGHADLLYMLNGQIIFNGRRAHSEVINAIANSDFTIFFRDTNRVTKAGFPSKYSESIACGTPVITNLMSNINPYIVQSKNTFLVDIDSTGKSLLDMENILALSDVELQQAKEFCLSDRHFDFRAYIDSVSLFLTKLEKGK